MFKSIFRLGLFFLFVSLLTISCGTTRFTGETVKYENVDSGQLSIKSGGYGVNQNVAVNNAIQNAFKNILIHGIPGTNQDTPLLGKNARIVYDENKTFLDNFIKTKSQEFILDKKVEGFKFTNKNNPSTEVSMLINLNSLRTYLEQNGMIRSFGL